MTNREFFKAIASNETIATDLREHAEAALVKLDNALEARKNKPSKTALENAPLIEQIVNEVLGSEGKTAMDVAAEVGISTQKASALLRQIVASGKATVADVKIAKKGTVKAYTLAE